MCPSIDKLVEASWCSGLASKMLQAFQNLYGSLRAANGLSKVWKMLKPLRLPRLEMLRFLDLSFGGSTAGNLHFQTPTTNET